VRNILLLESSSRLFGLVLLSSWLLRPSEKLWSAYSRIAKYLVKTRDFRLFFGTPEIKLMDLEPYGHSDSDWDRSIDDRKSTGVYVFLLLGSEHSRKSTGVYIFLLLSSKLSIGDLSQCPLPPHSQHQRWGKGALMSRRRHSIVPLPHCAVAFSDLTVQALPGVAATCLARRGAGGNCKMLAPECSLPGRFEPWRPNWKELLPPVTVCECSLSSRLIFPRSYSISSHVHC